MAERFTAVPRDLPSIISSRRGPGDIDSNRLVADVSDTIYLYQSSANPLTALLGKLRDKRKATQYRIDWLETDEYPRTAAVATAASAAATSIVIETGTGARFAANYVLLNTRTRETVLITSIATDTLTVVRGIGSSATAMEVGDTLDYVATAFEDGAGFGALRTVKEADVFNYLQIVRSQFGVTGRMVNTDLYGGKDQMFLRKIMGIEHQRSIEKLAFFGTRQTRTGANGKLQTHTGGAEYYIKSNVWNLGGIKPTERAFVEWLEVGMKWPDQDNSASTRTKFLFHSARWGTEIEFFAKDKLRTEVLQDVGGLALKRYLTTHGELMLVHAPILDYAHPDWAFLIDLNNVRYAYHQGRDTMLLKSREAPDVDAEDEEYLTDCGFEFRLEGSHGIAKGLPV